MNISESAETGKNVYRFISQDFLSRIRELSSVNISPVATGVSGAGVSITSQEIPLQGSIALATPTKSNKINIVTTPQPID